MTEVDYRLHRCAEVAPGLLCGSMRALSHVKALNITHVLSVYNLGLNKLSDDIEHLHIQIYDEEGTDILQILSRTHRFIEEGLKTTNGRVLVHCFAGLSRSVTVVVSYLMKTQGMTVEKALNYMDERYPHTCPNSGFLHQLEIFYRSGYDCDRASEALKQERALLNKRKSTPIKIVRRHSQKSEPVTTQMPGDLDFTFECRKCHGRLGTASSVHDAASIDLFSESGSMFVEKLEWMEDQCCNKEVAGKLYCPQCGEKLGSYNWAGISDDSVWHVPGFQLHLDKLDLRSSRDDPSSNIHHPKFTSKTAEPSESVKDANGSKESVDGLDFFVFDCDGVLVDTEVASCESLRLGIRDITGFDIPHTFPDDYVAVFGMDVRLCVQYYNDTFNRKWDNLDDLASKIAISKEQHYTQLTEQNSISAFDGIIPLIDRLRASHIPFGVASSGHPSKLQRNLEISGLIDHFDPRLVVSASEVEHGKPSPDVYLELFRRIGCLQCPDRCLVIEDSLNGLKAAKAAGAYTVGITNSLSEVLLKPHADLVIDHISALYALIPSNRSGMPPENEGNGID